MDKNNTNIWKNLFYGTAVLLVATLLALVGTISQIASTKDNAVSDDDLAALAVFDEVAQGFLTSPTLDLGVGRNISAEVLGHGVSEDDDFYVHFKMCYYNDAGERDGCKNGKIYFWESEDGHRSYGFSYDE